nr:hypothetical protein [Tanacetum cinerariifolium]
LWLIRIEQYFLMTDYSLWEVIKNGNKVQTKTVRTVEQTYEPTSVEEKLDMKNGMKTRGTLLMAHPNKDQLKFHSYQNAKMLMETIEKSTSSTNEADNTAYGVSTAHTQGLQSVEERLVHYKKNEAIFADKINIVNLKVKLRDNAIVEYTKKLEKVEKEKDELKLTLRTSPAIENFVNSSEMLEIQENVKSRSDKGYHALLPPYSGNYIPPKPDLMFIDEQVKSEFVDVVSNVSSSVVKTVESKFESVNVKNKGVYNTVQTKPVRKNNFSPPIIKDCNYDDESEVEFEPKVEVKIVRPSIEKIKFVKIAREKVEKVETPKQHEHYPRGNQRNWNNLMS